MPELTAGQASLDGGGYSQIEALVAKMEAGVDLKRHLGRRVDTAFLSSHERAALPPHQREQDLDRMLADWACTTSISRVLKTGRLRPARKPSPTQSRWVKMPNRQAADGLGLIMRMVF